VTDTLDNALDLTLDPVRLVRLTAGTVVVSGARAILEVTGPGAVQCLQGLLTNDLVKPGDATITWGALLTPKGMIESDLWALRHGETVTLLLPSVGLPAVAAAFKRALPPRLARGTDRSAEWATLLLIGAGSEATLRESGIMREAPVPGHVAITESGLWVGRPQGNAPFDLVLAGPIIALTAAEESLKRAGAAAGDAADAEASRILAGWPALGAEIDDKTLPQEVRFDELGGVSYTKGCYLGQETVARIHFRGHPNRELRGLEWDDAAPLEGRGIAGAGRDAGTVRSTLVAGGKRLGLAPIRREINVGDEVTAGGRLARVVALPFGDPRVA
jgi:folate-binding protein YgfZ